MPIGNIVALGFILTFFGTFMVALAWARLRRREPPSRRITKSWLQSESAVESTDGPQDRLDPPA